MNLYAKIINNRSGGQLKVGILDWRWEVAYPIEKRRLLLPTEPMENIRTDTICIQKKLMVYPKGVDSLKPKGLFFRFLNLLLSDRK